MLIVGTITAVIAIVAAVYSTGYKHGVMDTLHSLDDLFNNNKDGQSDN